MCEIEPWFSESAKAVYICFMRTDGMSTQMEDFEEIRDLIDGGQLAEAEQAMQQLSPQQRLSRQVLEVRLLSRRNLWQQAYTMGQLAVQQAMDAKDEIMQVFSRSEWVVPQWELQKWEEMVENIRQAEVIVDQLHREHKFPILIPLAQLNLYMGQYYMRKGMLETGTRYFRKSFFAYRNGREEGLSGLPLSKIGQAYFAEGMYDGALLYQYEALNLFERFGAKEWAGEEWGRAADTHAATRNYNRAVEAAERSLRFFREIGKDDAENSAREKLQQLQEIQAQRAFN